MIKTLMKRGQPKPEEVDKSVAAAIDAAQIPLRARIATLESDVQLLKKTIAAIASANRANAS